MLLILVGFLLMSGGSSADPTAFDPAIFSPQRIVLAPIVCLAGFLLMIYAILVKPGKAEKPAGEEGAEG